MALLSAILTILLHGMIDANKKALRSSVALFAFWESGSFYVEKE